MRGGSPPDHGARRARGEALCFAHRHTLPAMRLPLFRLLACLALLTAPLHLSAQDDPLSARLLPKDPKQPLHMLAEKSWSGADLELQPHAVTQTPPHQPRRSLTLPLGAFKSEPGLGPMVLLVAYGGRLVDSNAKGSGIVSVDIECPETSGGCGIPINQTLVSFDSTYMASSRKTEGGAIRTLVLGREGHRYSFPPGTLVKMDLSLLEPTNIEPAQLQAWVFHGEHDPALPQARKTRSGTLWKVLGAGALVVLLGVWWVRRRAG